MALGGWDDGMMGYVNFNSYYPLVNKAIENGHRNSELSHNKMVILHSYVSLPEGNVVKTIINYPFGNGLYHLLGGLEHEFGIFPFSWECHNPN